MTAWWYWALFALAALLILAVPLSVWLERRADARDKAAWDAIYAHQKDAA